MVLAAIYLLKMIQLTIWGPITKDENRKLNDLSCREMAALVPLCILMLWIGVAPDAFLQPSRQALEQTCSPTTAVRVDEPAVTQASLRPVDPTDTAALSRERTTTEAGR